MLVSSITSRSPFLYIPVIFISPWISNAFCGELLPIPIRDLPPPIKYRLLEAFVFVPICVFGIVAVADFMVSVFKTSSVVAVIVVVEMLSPTDNALVIFALPTTSRETVGDELPIPIRASPPPTKYRLLEAFVFVPNCAIGVVRVAVSAMITPVEFIEDA